MKISQAQVLQVDEPASKALAMISKSGVGVLVFDGKKYVGMVDERQMHGYPTDPAKTRCEKLAVKTPIISPADSVADACKAFFAGRFKTLPVMEGTQLRGVVTRWDVMEELESDRALSAKVGAFMSAPILTIDAAAPVSLAHALMRQANVRRLAVLENGHLVGLLSVFDLLRVDQKPKDRRPQMREKAGGYDAPIASLMKTDVESIGPTATLAQASKLMRGKGVSALIVMEGERPVGILSSKDVMEAALHAETEVPVFVSGLHGMDHSVGQDIVDEAHAAFKKIGTLAGAEAISLHVKRTGSQYNIAAHVRGKTPLRAYANGWDLMEAVRVALGELKTQALKGKKTGMSKRQNN